MQVTSSINLEVNKESIQSSPLDQLLEKKQILATAQKYINSHSVYVQSAGVNRTNPNRNYKMDVEKTDIERTIEQMRKLKIHSIKNLKIFNR